MSILFSIVAEQLTFPPTVLEGFLFSTSSPAFIVCRFFDDGHQSEASHVAQWVKNPPTMQEMKADVGSVPKLRRSPAGGHGNPLQYSCQDNPMDRGDWRRQYLESQRVRHS